MPTVNAPSIVRPAPVDSNDGPELAPRRPLDPKVRREERWVIALMAGFAAYTFAVLLALG